MARIYQTYCPHCDSEVAANVINTTEKIKIRGEYIVYEAEKIECPACGRAIGDSRAEAKNLERAYSIYRDKHNLVSPSDIANLRKAYGLSLREFSKFLGFGEQTVTKYESGSLPDDLHSNMVKMARTALGAKTLLGLNLEKLSSSSIEKIEQYISSIESDPDYDDRWFDLRMLDDDAEAAPSRKNGYRSFDMERAASLVATLAAKCSKLYKTKLQKAMFFCDFLSCERFGRSITGLSYAHANYGPIINNGDYLIARLSDEGSIRLEECGWGEIVKSESQPLDIFTAAESELIDEVASFVDSFSTASSISDFSHGLRAWNETPNGHLIDYNLNFGEISQSIQRRKNLE